MQRLYQYILVICMLVGNPLYSQQAYFNLRYNLFPQGSWEGLNSCIETAEGYVVCGNAGHPLNPSWRTILISQINYSGEKQWYKLLGDTIAGHSTGIGALIKLQDGNYCLAGTKRYPGDTIKDVAFICKLNQYFDTVWLVDYGNIDPIIDTVNLGQQVKELDNHDLILVGGQYYYGGLSKCLLIRTTESGEKIWEKTYGEIGLSQAFSVVQTSDGGFAIGGFWYIPGSTVNCGDPIVIKTDSLGNKEWELNLGGEYIDHMAMLGLDNYGNIVAGTLYADSMTGPTIHHNPYNRVHVVKIDLSGNILWDKKYGNSNMVNIYLTSLKCTDDGSIVICGSRPKVENGAPASSGWILKLNNQGDSLWYRYYENLGGSSSLNVLSDIIQTSDNGFLSCGYVYPLSPDTGNQDAWILKLDSNGCDTPGCSPGVGQVEPFDMNSSIGLSIYPNPSNCMLNIEFQPTHSQALLVIINQFGIKQDEITIPKNIPRTQIDISTYAPGFYVAVLKNNYGQIQKGKFLVKR